MSVVDQVITIYAGTQGLWDQVEVEDVHALAPQLIKFVHEAYPELVRRLNETLRLEDADGEALREAIQHFLRQRTEKQAS